MEAFSRGSFPDDWRVGRCRHFPRRPSGIRDVFSRDRGFLLNDVHQYRSRFLKGKVALRRCGVFRISNDAGTAVRKLRAQFVRVEAVIWNVRRNVKRQRILACAPSQPKAMHDDEGDQ